MNTPEQKLVYMANQIGKAFAALPHEQAVAEIATHLKSFWEKRMLARIFNYMDAGGAGIDDLPKLSLQNLRQTKA
jgi:formate dehydrogenase subunit delta